MTREEIQKELDRRSEVFMGEPGPYHHPAANMAAMLLAVHAELDKVANDERAKRLKRTVANIRAILGRTA